MGIRWLYMAFAGYWWLLALAPVSRADWVLENVLTVVGVTLLVRGSCAGMLSPGAAVLGLAFLFLHTTGAHFTYSAVPYDDWARSIFGHALSDVTGWQRNHFDRLVHFAFGAMVALPARQWLCNHYALPARYAGGVVLMGVMSLSMLYELIEWAAAITFGDELGSAYVGAQGDEWDAQQDMALATAGALIANWIIARSIKQHARIENAVRVETRLDSP